MHYSQMKKQGSSRRNAHPGTPRPNPENYQPGEIRSHHVPPSSAAAAEASQLQQERLVFNFKRQEKANKSHQQQQRSCGLPKHEKVGAQVSPTNSSENLPNFLVWVKNEPFDFGILSPLPCPKIGINILRKIAEYCREKPGHFPGMTLNQWNHICKYKMQLATDLSFTYFRLFDVLTRPISNWTNHLNSNPNSNHNDVKQKHNEIADPSSDGSAGESWDTKFHKVVKQGHDPNDEFKVDTMQFLLFLYIQHFLRLHKKYFMKSYGDEPWPKVWISNLMQRSNGAGTGANVPEQQQAEFIMANLPDIIDFLMLLHENGKGVRENEDKTDSRSSKSKHKEDANVNSNEHAQYQRITIEVVRALSFILGVASTTPNTEFKTLDECLHLSDIRWKLEYSRYSRTVDKKCFIQWVMRNLKINPWGPSSVPIPQMSLSVMTGVTDDVECFKQNKIFWNTQSYPKTWFLISGVERQVLVIDTLEPMSSIKIHRCTNAFIYLPGVYSYILVQKCHGITLNIGVATKIVKFLDCSDITVSGVGRQFLISDISLSTFHMLTPSSPIICGSKNHGISLAPYNTGYPKLTSHMKTAGISAKIQRWNKPLEIANDGYPRAFQQSNVLPLAPEQFKMLMFPFKAVGGSSTNLIGNIFPLPGMLPSLYQRRVDYASEKMEEARREFATKLVFSEEDTSLIYQITLQRFKKWLKESGHYEQVVGLRSYQKSLEQESSLPVVCSKGHDLSCVARALKNFFKCDANFVDSVRSNLSVSSSNRSNRSRHIMKQHDNHRSTNSDLICGGAGDENKVCGDLSVSKGQYFVKSSSSLSFHARDSKRGGGGDDDI